MKRVLLFLALITFAFCSRSTESSQPEGTIIIEASNLESSKGIMRSHLYNSSRAKYFPASSNKAFKKTTAKISGNKAIIVYKNIPFGKYAFTLHQDEDNNGKMNKNFFGIPSEPFGISTNPKIILSAPSFEESEFEFNKKEMHLKVKMIRKG